MKFFRKPADKIKRGHAQHKRGDNMGSTIYPNRTYFRRMLGVLTNKIKYLGFRKLRAFSIEFRSLLSELSRFNGSKVLTQKFLKEKGFSKIASALQDKGIDNLQFSFAVRSDHYGGSPTDLSIPLIERGIRVALREITTWGLPDTEKVITLFGETIGKCSVKINVPDKEKPEIMLKIYRLGAF